jgi:hypothetical protein
MSTTIFAVALETSRRDNDTDCVAAKTKRVAPAETNLNTREAVERFQRAADAFLKKHGRSKASARKILIEIGIYDKSGRLAKKYRGE